METIRKPIDFGAIAAETGVRKGKIIHSKHSGWVVIGHPDIDMICIDAPLHKGKLPDMIENDEWIYKR